MVVDIFRFEPCLPKFLSQIKYFIERLNLRRNSRNLTFGREILMYKCRRSLKELHHQTDCYGASSKLGPEAARFNLANLKGKVGLRNIQQFTYFRIH